MSYILTYVRVALATSDAHSILEIPASEKQNNNAEYIAMIIIFRGVETKRPQRKSCKPIKSS